MSRIESLERSMVIRKRAEDSFSDQLGALRVISKSEPGKELAKISQEISHRTILRKANGEETTQDEMTLDEDAFENSECDSETNSESESTSVLNSITTELTRSRSNSISNQSVVSNSVSISNSCSTSVSCAVSNPGGSGDIIKTTNYFNKFNPWNSAMHHQPQTQKLLHNNHNIKLLDPSASQCSGLSNTSKNSKSSNSKSSSRNTNKSKNKNKNKNKSKKRY